MLTFQALVVRLAETDVDRFRDFVLTSPVTDPLPRTRNDQKFHGSSRATGSGAAAASGRYTSRSRSAIAVDVTYRTSPSFSSSVYPRRRSSPVSVWRATCNSIHRRHLRNGRAR